MTCYFWGNTFLGKSPNLEKGARNGVFMGFMCSQKLRIWEANNVFLGKFSHFGGFYLVFGKVFGKKILCSNF